MLLIEAKQNDEERMKDDKKELEDSKENEIATTVPNDEDDVFT